MNCCYLRRQCQTSAKVLWGRQTKGGGYVSRSEMTIDRGAVYSCNILCQVNFQSAWPLPPSLPPWHPSLSGGTETPVLPVQP